VRAGIEGRKVFEQVCEIFYDAGQPTQLSKEPGQVLDSGFYHGLGHGVGLEVHEQPWLGRAPGSLVAGDVVTLEPGLYRHGYGGVRLEDLALVTADGCENLTSFPYDLQP
jgi:Xaa-Pro aminopeptidase